MRIHTLRMDLSYEEWKIWFFYVFKIKNNIDLEYKKKREYIRNNDDIYSNMESIVWFVGEYNLAYISMRKVWKRRKNNYCVSLYSNIHSGSRIDEKKNI